MNKFARKRTENLVGLNDINEKLKLIEGTDDYFVGSNGNVYHQYDNGMYFKLKPYKNMAAKGYMYVSLQINGKAKLFRVHRLVANAFIPNPKKYKEVDHIDSNKANNSVSNLQWVTGSQNCLKRNKDGLLVNDKGFDDSQSMPVVCLNKSLQIYRIFGSICIAHKEIGVSKSTISRQMNHKSKSIRCGYYFRSLEEYNQKGFVL